MGSLDGVKASVELEGAMEEAPGTGIMAGGSVTCGGAGE